MPGVSGGPAPVSPACLVQSVLPGEGSQRQTDCVRISGLCARDGTHRCLVCVQTQPLGCLARLTLTGSCQDVLRHGGREVRGRRPRLAGEQRVTGMGTCGERLSGDGHASFPRTPHALQHTPRSGNS